MSTGLQRRADDESKRSSNSWEGLGIRILLGVGLYVVQDPASLFLMSGWFNSSAKPSSPATSFRKTAKTARGSTLPKLRRCSRPLSYYADGSHPCADMFFKDGTDALYLVDVGGTCNMTKALNKVQKMNDVLANNSLRDDLPVSGLKGVVLLPNIESISQDDGTNSAAIIVTGARARELLGGLVQLLAWLPAGRSS